jgi:catechol 2,3-dioxygenase-like lactoylglutathione lyase family enzyme
MGLRDDDGQVLVSSYDKYNLPRMHYIEPNLNSNLLMEMKLELVAIPVTDVDRARDFYKDKVGFNLDHDHIVSEKLRFVQMTPLGSACSICFGIGIADDMKPGSIKGLQMVVKDAQAAHDELKGRGVDVSEVDTQAWGKFVRFNDPDGNAWALQEIPPRSQSNV